MAVNSQQAEAPCKGGAPGYQGVVFPAVVATIISILLFIVYRQAFFGYQTDDYSLAYAFIDGLAVDSGAITSVIPELLAGALGGGKIHWTPVTNVILFFTLEDDSLSRVLLVNLAVVLLAATVVAMIARAMGAARLPALFAGAWVGTSQVLVFAATSIWGVMNLLAPLLGMLASLMLWRWVSAQYFANRENDRSNSYYAAFLLLFFLALMTKESEIRWVLAVGLSSLLFVAFGKTMEVAKKAFFSMALVGTVVVAYFALRYFFTDAQVPLLRSPDELAQTYHQPRMSMMFFAKNVSQLLFGSMTPVNSYSIYLSQKNGFSLQFLLLLLPGAMLGFSLLAGYVWVFARGLGNDRMILGFCGLLVLSSLFPEALLGKVSEIYAMATVWPLAVTGALVFGRIASYNRKVSIVLAVSATALVALNLQQAKAKVSEYMVTSDYAHSMRMSMLEKTRDLPDGSRIGLIHEPRSAMAFGPFGEKGIYASGARPRITPHEWKLFEKGQESELICEMDLLLEESEDRTRVQVSVNYKNKLCNDGREESNSARL